MSQICFVSNSQPNTTVESDYKDVRPSGFTQNVRVKLLRARPYSALEEACARGISAVNDSSVRSVKHAFTRSELWLVPAKLSQRPERKFRLGSLCARPW
jgi:hypothetical protein